jgi:hypothetical protein
MANGARVKKTVCRCYLFGTHFRPRFSLARSIFEDKDIPAVGQKWDVKVHLLEANDDAGTN